MFKKNQVNCLNKIAIVDSQIDFDMAFNAGLKGFILVSMVQNTIKELKEINQTNITSQDYLSIKSL